MTSSLLVSSCTFNRLGWEGTRGWTWTLLGLKRVAEADESASGWASVGPYSSRGGKKWKKTYSWHCREPEAQPWAGRLGKAAIPGWNAGVWLLGRDGLAERLPLRTASSRPTSLEGSSCFWSTEAEENISYISIWGEHHFTNVTTLCWGHCTDTFTHPRKLQIHKELVLLKFSLHLFKLGILFLEISSSVTSRPWQSQI